MRLVLPVLLFVLSCNLDTFLLAVSFSLRGVSLPLSRIMIIAAVTTVITAISLLLGTFARSVFPDRSTRLGGLVLMGMGLWFLLDGLRHWGQTTTSSQPLDTDAASCLPLAAALAVNNAGAGVAAGMSGLSPLGASCANFIITLLCLLPGARLGKYLAGRQASSLALPVSGLLLLLLGAWETFGLASFL